jgi:hypothetical protein
MSRYTTTNFPGAFRLVVTKSMGGEDYTQYHGPYQTIGAAKGQLTQELKMRDYEHYETKTGHIETTSGAWMPVEEIEFQVGPGFVIE